MVLTDYKEIPLENNKFLSTNQSAISVYGETSYSTPINTIFDTGQISGILYRNKEEILEFLENNSAVSYFLENIWSKIQNYFGKDAQVVLELDKSIEKSGQDRLIGWIQTTFDIDNAMLKLDSLEEEIFELQMRLVGETFHFNIEFE